MKEKIFSRFSGTTIAILLALYTTFAVAQVHFVTVNINQPAPLVIHAGNDITLCSGSGDTLHATGGTSYTWNPSYGLSCTNCSAPYAKPDTTTTYIVMASGDYNCTARDTVIVTVAPTLVANAGHDTSVCSGKSITLHASGGTNYSWSPARGLSGTTIPDPIAKPDSTTRYTVTVTSGSCEPSVASVTVTVLPNPPVPTVTKSGFTLTSSSATGNQWNRNGVPISGATSQSYTVTQNGNYTVAVTGSNGCSSTSDSVNVTVGVQSEIPPRGTSDLVFFPNPNNGAFTFSFNADQQSNYDIELRDVLGRLIHQEHLNKFLGHYSEQFDLHVYPKGFYSLLVRSGTERMVVKVLKY